MCSTTGTTTTLACAFCDTFRWLEPCPGEFLSFQAPYYTQTPCTLLPPHPPPSRGTHNTIRNPESMEKRSIEVTFKRMEFFIFQIIIIPANDVNLLITLIGLYDLESLIRPPRMQTHSLPDYYYYSGALWHKLIRRMTDLYFLFFLPTLISADGCGWQIDRFIAIT
jgi:hypothetical protein